MLAAEGEGPVSEGDGVVSLLFGFYATPPGGWGVLLGLERSHVVGCLSGRLARWARWFRVQAMAQWHELLHVPLAFANAFTNSSLMAFCP